jgi:hypoxanthine phosphoribosyltransferase
MRVLISQQELERRVRELAAEIDRDYSEVGGGAQGQAPHASELAGREPAQLLLRPPDRDAGEPPVWTSGDLPVDLPPQTGMRRRAPDDPLICVGVLKGSVFFLTELLKLVTVPVAVDFFQTSSYGSRGASRGEVHIRKDIDLAIGGHDVLLIEDIVDTGYTLRTILDLLRFRGARSVRLCALLDKVSAREVEVKIDYLGFQIENAFVVGYGLDFGERYRNLPYIAVYEPDEPSGVPSGTPPLPAR